MKQSLADQGFIWWVGVVESRHDPAKLGRVQVRIFGYHTHDKSELPTSDLPWAMIMMPSNSASNSGIGFSPTGLLEGSWVIGFFLDGNRAQEPLVMGSIPGFDDGYSNTGGFTDPNGIYPRETGPSIHNRSQGVDPHTAKATGDVALNTDLATFVSEFEGFHARAYWDYAQYTNGFGTKAKSPTEVIDRETARLRLAKDLAYFAGEVEKINAKYQYKWTQNQKDALTSFAFNLGAGRLKTLTDNGRRSNSQIADAMLLYNKAGGKTLQGLAIRRSAESAKFKQDIGTIV